jgi:HEPN domain-containing protein
MATFIACLHNLDNAVAQCGLETIPESRAKSVCENAVEGLAVELKNSGLERLAGEAARLKARLAYCNAIQIMPLLASLKDNVIYALTSDLFLKVPPEAKPFFLSVQFSPESVSSFGRALHDMKAASRCLALDEWDACVFHCMRVLEIGLASLASKFSVRYAHENWRNIINDITGKIKGICEASHGPDWKEEEHFYSSVALHFQFLTNGWRNYVMHGRETYDPREAQQIFAHVRDFMDVLSQKVDDSHL